MKKIFFLIIIVFLVTTSCEIIRGYDAYVYKNQYGRRELKQKKFKNKFSQEMSKGLVFDKLYYNYYEDSSINYKRHSYLRLFPSGQYAVFGDTIKEIDINDLDKAGFVGYYIVKKDSLLELETPQGNFNTESYRVISKYRIKPLGLERKKKRDIFSEEWFTLEENKDLDLSVKPNW